MLSLPPELPACDFRAFLGRHWQKAPLWMPAAADLTRLPDTDPDELPWLATEDDVESRLVFTESRDGKPFYRVETGPFEAAMLESLPASNWTLLVQDVDKHLPEFRRFLDLVRFIPDWRIDDLMISVAAPGGSVGPHVDNYDVFLVQTRGNRHWQWTDERPGVDKAASEQLRLVRPFSSDAGVTAEPGDVLYLHPGIAHHGIAEDLCVTCSIGMRAPQLSELSGSSADRDDPFYSDADLDPREARPGYISPQAVERAASLLRSNGLAARDAEVRLGRFATVPKAWLRPDPPCDSLPSEGTALEVHGMARLAWTDDRVFANGLTRNLPASGAGLIEALALARRLDLKGRLAWQRTEGMSSMLAWLWECGVFDPEFDRARAT